ncbi:hypothetical protein [Gordonia neofelifaecis]|uniref:Uncharacterized protein n=1 Tax=Gordonia neofelifaecis NRRL B-59395 TaxID=644548 RepID=F1YF85_9ACTN|nr:hypothetical protein [Gordonia neofelifaecis]EGD56624.1 hypothetical protein SCNU_03697 [Gordonia neofelifaecis NRRL B-59395]
MTYNDPHDPGYHQQPPPTRAYSQPGDYPQYPDANAADYSRSAYDPSYAQQPAPSKPPRRGPDIDPLMFCGGVLMTGVVTGLAAWLAAWVIRAITQKINESGQFGIWNPLAQDEVWFAVAGFVCAILGGALWYLLQVGTPAPNQFYRWIVGLLIAAAVILPLLLSDQISSGIGTAVLHLIIGLPVLTLIPTMGHASSNRNRS